jgi:adenylate cyclase class 2
MSASGQELEVKFYLLDLPALEGRLLEAGAVLVQPRNHEVNLRFDTPQDDLSRSYRVLRLRQDTEARLTYKGPGVEQDGVRLRQELEFTVSDFSTAQAFLEALGYRVVWMYEKYRATYSLGGLLVVLDELPYGSFIEIEGPDGASIQKAAVRLGVDWEKRILESYAFLFDRLRQAQSLPFRDLSFDNFAGRKVSAAELGVAPAG